eukprot:6030585-Prymnesium_polylepis.1
MEEEIRGKVEVNKAWTLVPELPAGRKAMKGKWVFTVEYNDDGSIKRFKARFVGCGYSQIPGVDYGDTYASTAQRVTVCTAYAIAASLDLILHEYDFIKAFTMGESDGIDLYVEQPPGFVDPTMAACKLNRPLEGTKQAAALWMKTLAKRLVAIGFKRSVIEPNIYTKVEGDCILRVLVYVDNLLAMYPDTEMGEKMNKQLYTDLKQTLNLQDRGEPTVFMGVEISRDRAAKIITLTQSKYILNVCHKYLDSNSKTLSTPVPHTKLDTFNDIAAAKDDMERSAMRDKAYLSIMGALLWICVTHPEI